MTDLTPNSVLGGARHDAHGSVLSEATPSALFLIQPFPGQAARVTDALISAYGVPFPGPGETARTAQVEIRWAGRAQALLFATNAPGGLGDAAAATDVSDVYARLLLTGAAGADILARFVPIDLSPSAFPSGATAKTLLNHIPAHVTSLADGFEIMVMRSFAHTAFHEIAEAMTRLEARSAIA
ncbi:MAG: sarcosine oxidase subunit gamma [Pseudomonadota bacterium]